MNLRKFHQQRQRNFGPNCRLLLLPLRLEFESVFQLGLILFLTNNSMSQTRTCHVFFLQKLDCKTQKRKEYRLVDSTKRTFCFLEPYPFANPWTFRDGKWWWKRSLMSDASWCFVACLCRFLWFWWPRWGKGICSNLIQSGPPTSYK